MTKLRRCGGSYPLNAEDLSTLSLAHRLLRLRESELEVSKRQLKIRGRRHFELDSSEREFDKELNVCGDASNFVRCLDLLGGEEGKERRGDGLADANMIRPGRAPAWPGAASIPGRSRHLGGQIIVDHRRRKARLPQLAEQPVQADTARASANIPWDMSSHNPI